MIAWIILPMTLGIVVVVSTLFFAITSRSLKRGWPAASILPAVLWAELMFYRIGRGAYPTFVPHFVLGIAIVFTIVQAVRTIDNVE